MDTRLMRPPWFKPRKYRHFDMPVPETKAEFATDAAAIKGHSFLPLLHVDKTEIRYRLDPETNKKARIEKTRSIRYASHRDSCILAFYASKLNQALERHYQIVDWSDCVLAYRKLGKANYHFAAEARNHVISCAPMTVLAFDVSKFFDTLDHKLLKERIKRLLGTNELTPDWYAVLKAVTKFRFVKHEDLIAEPILKKYCQEVGRPWICGIKTLKQLGVEIYPNPNETCGVPQGTPISAALSNAYMIDFDAAAFAACSEIGALYRRYSDDILIICSTESADAVIEKIESLMSLNLLTLSSEKTERTEFTVNDSKIVARRTAQYLGFAFDHNGARIRESSISRQWKKLIRSINAVEAKWRTEIAEGRSNFIHTKRLVKRFQAISSIVEDIPRPVRNFSSYARRSAAAFGPDDKILHQVRRLEREALSEIRRLKRVGRR